jgi:hypothetical protein
MVVASGLVLLLSSMAQAQQPEIGAPMPIAKDIADFIEAQFLAVPAPSVVAGIRGATCAEQKLSAGTLQPPGVGAALISIYLCSVDCGGLGSVPVWRDSKGTLWIGPDSVETLVATFCPDSITDETKRAHLVEDVQRGG